MPQNGNRTPAHRSRRERIIRRFQKYVTNPPVRLLVRAGLLPTTALLETIGRKTGRPRRIPVGNGYDTASQTFWVIAEHGLGASWVRNVQANPRVRVKIGIRWRTGRATLLPDDNPLQRQHVLARQGLTRKVTAVAVRLFATDPMTVRIDLDPPSGPPETQP